MSARLAPACVGLLCAVAVACSDAGSSGAGDAAVADAPSADVAFDTSAPPDADDGGLPLVLGPEADPPSDPVGTGVNYYIDSVAGDDAHDGSLASPWKTPAKLLPLLGSFGPGDMVHFKRGGSYDVASLGERGIQVSASGTSNAPITFTAYGSGARPIVRNSATSSPWIADFDVKGDWVVVDRLELTGAHEAGVALRGTHGVVQNCDIHSVGAGVQALGEDATVVHDHFHDGTMVIDTQGGNDDYGANGVVVFASRAEIAMNVAENLAAPSYDYGTDGGFVELYAAAASTIDGVEVHHNVVHDSMGFVEAGGAPSCTLTNALFAYNLSVNDYDFSTLHDDVGNDGFACTITGFRFVDNTIVEPNASIPTINVGAASPGALAVEDNVFAVAGPTKVYAHGSIAHDHNLYFLTSGAALGDPIGSSELLADPLFVAPPSDYRLGAGSPALDVGVTAAYPYDLDGHAVPRGAGTDLGAYER